MAASERSRRFGFRGSFVGSTMVEIDDGVARDQVVTVLGRDLGPRAGNGCSGS